ncbi:ATP-binding protein [Mycobacterium sp. BMJ-28]
MTGQAQSGARFTRNDVEATPDCAAMIRREFADWLHAHFTLDKVKGSDILLALYEALANAAEFAYFKAQEPGMMHVRADYDRQRESLTVLVIDEGAWRAKDPAISNPARGRGIPLMHALSDRAVIDSTATGTQVRLQWDHIGAVPDASAEIRTAGA